MKKVLALLLLILSLLVFCGCATVPATMKSQYKHSITIRSVMKREAGKINNITIYRNYADYYNYDEYYFETTPVIFYYNENEINLVATEYGYEFKEIYHKNLSGEPTNIILEIALKRSLAQEKVIKFYGEPDSVTRGIEYKNNDLKYTDYEEWYYFDKRLRIDVSKKDSCYDKRILSDKELVAKLMSEPTGNPPSKSYSSGGIETWWYHNGGDTRKVTLCGVDFDGRFSSACFTFRNGILIDVFKSLRCF